MTYYGWQTNANAHIVAQGGDTWALPGGSGGPSGILRPASSPTVTGGASYSRSNDPPGWQKTSYTYYDFDPDGRPKNSVKGEPKPTDPGWGKPEVKLTLFQWQTPEPETPLAWGSYDTVVGIATKNAYAEGGFHAAAAEVTYGASANAAISEKGLQVQLAAEAALYLGRVEATGKTGYQWADWGRIDAEGKAEAYVGAEAEAKATLELGRAGANVGFEAEAFAGGKASIEGSVTPEIAGVQAKVAGSAAVTYGIGGTADFKFVFKDGKLRIREKLGVTAGVGFEQSLDFEVDVGAIAKKLWDWGRAGAAAGVAEGQAVDTQALKPDSTGGLSPPWLPAWDGLTAASKRGWAHV